MTNLSEADRSRIYTGLSEVTSSRTAEVLMQSIVDAPWDILATKEHVDAEFAKIDVRFDAMQARTDATIERAIRRQTIWLMSAMFAFNGLLAAWFSAFH